MGDNKILLYNRVDQVVEREEVFTKWFMLCLYGNPNRLFLAKCLASSIWFSKFYGLFKNSSFSRKSIQKFVKNYQIDISEAELPIDAYKTFNDFFIRKLKSESRPVERNSDILISPADARVTVYNIKYDRVILVKGKAFTLNALINDWQLASNYIDGICIVLRLAPVDYHRFCYIDECQQSPVKIINGFLHSVNPLALRQKISVFTENMREYCVLHTENFGDVLHIDVGALVVGRITQHHRNGAKANRGDEKGFFELGGSTIILVFEQGKVKIDADIEKYSLKGIETLVKYGERIGIKA